MSERYAQVQATSVAKRKHKFTGDSRAYNTRDKNAVIVEAYLNNDWYRIGYILKDKFRKVVVAVRNSQDSPLRARRNVFWDHFLGELRNQA